MSYTMLLGKTRTARKTHRCIWCGEAIAVGEKYEDRRYMFEGVFSRDKTHPECLTAMESSDDVGDGFYPYEQLRGMTMDDSQEEKDRRFRQKEIVEEVRMMTP